MVIDMTEEGKPEVPKDDAELADPMTQMVQGAIQVHEMYLSYVAAGFNEQQVLYFLGVFMANLLLGRQT
jgi:hypothetical protein